MMAYRTAPVVDRAETGELVETIIGMVAKAHGTDPRDMEPQLIEVLDPDALDRIFRDRCGRWKATGRGSIEFRVHDCHVLVRDTGHVVVTRESTARSGSF